MRRRPVRLSLRLALPLWTNCRAKRRTRGGGRPPPGGGTARLGGAGPRGWAGEQGGEGAPAGEGSEGGEEGNGPAADALESKSPGLSGVSSAYPGDNASSARIAAWMGAEAQRRGLPPQLPVMAAPVEAHPEKLAHRGARSLGQFHIRLGTS